MVTVFEVDHPATQAVKREVFAASEYLRMSSLWRQILSAMILLSSCAPLALCLSGDRSLCGSE